MSRFIYPVDAPISQGFGVNNIVDYRKYGQLGHNGIDFAAALNTPVKAAADGVVHFEGDGAANSWVGSIAGTCVILDHGDVYTAYAHLSSTIVDKGQSVKQGQVIGYSGQTGAATGPHLHFEFIGKPPVFGNGYAGRVDPAKYNLGGNVVDYQAEYQELKQERDKVTYPIIEQQKAQIVTLTAQRDELTRERDQDSYPTIERQKAQIETLNARMVDMQAQIDDLTKKLEIAQAGNGDASKWTTLGLLLKELLGLNK